MSVEFFRLYHGKVDMNKMYGISASVFAAALIGSISSVAASECKLLPKKANSELFRAAKGVVRAQVTQSKLIDLRDLNFPCVNELCEVLRIELEIIDTYKSESSSTKTIYTSIPNECSNSVITGWRYILFLDEHELLPNSLNVSAYSHPLDALGAIFVSNDLPLIVEFETLSNEVGYQGVSR